MQVPADISPVPGAEAPRDCRRCPRLANTRQQLRASNPDWWNAPVPAFGDPAAWLAIVGLAPGRRGANRTGRPFTGDFAGVVLMESLLACGLAKGAYEARRDDGLVLEGAIILNAVKCLPPDNRPLATEIENCRPFLAAALDALPNLRVVIALGRVAHESLCRMAGPLAGYRSFSHGAEHELAGGRLLIDSYHCSRQNVNRRIISGGMLRETLERALAY